VRKVGGTTSPPTGDAVHADLRSRGVDVGEILRWLEAPAMFAVRDQDGNSLEVVEQS
jgi:lactoylglutathione lyase